MPKIFTGINIQWPISEHILNGDKTIETRTYPVPEKHLGVEMLLIETPGKHGKFKARIVAIIKFTDCFEYHTKKDFYNDSARHCVTRSSIWAWKDGPKFGWKVQVIKKISPPILAPSKKGIKYTNNIEL
jgi:hypothetical protein